MLSNADELGSRTRELLPFADSANALIAKPVSRAKLQEALAGLFMRC
jgi:hypothetical protein